MAAHNAAAVFRKRFGKLCDQGTYLRIRRCIGHKLHGAAAPAHRNAGRIERHMQIAKIHGRPLCRNHKNGVSLRRTLHNRIRPLFRVWPQKTMRMPAHNHVHPFHRTGQAAIFRQTEMRESDNMVYALLFQFLYRAGQNLFALLEAGGRTGCRQFHNFIIGKAYDTHRNPSYPLNDIGLHPAMPHRAFRLRMQIGRQSRKRRGPGEGRRIRAAFIKFMVAQGHGVIGHVGIYFSEHGPLVHAVKQRSLELVARIQRDNIIVFCFSRPYGGRDAAHASPAAGFLKAGVSVFIHTRNVRVDIVGMQNRQLKASAGVRLGKLPDGAAMQKKQHTQKGQRQTPRSRHSPLSHRCLPPEKICPCYGRPPYG